MKIRSAISCVAIGITATSLITSVVGCSKSNETVGISPAASTASAVPNSSTVKVASQLGDLMRFRLIATDVAADIDKGDLAAAKVRVKDLELAWDGAEAGLKPRAAEDWHVLDKAIDQVLKNLRADTPNKADSKQASDKLIEIFNAFDGK